MTKKLKDYLNKNRHILEDENYAELLANCPAEVVAELKLLLDDTGAKEEEEIKPLNPEQLVAWCNIGQSEQTYLGQIQLTKLKDATISDKFPYTNVLFPEGTWEHVVMWNNNYYVVTPELKDMIRTHRAEKATAARKASGVTQYNSYIYRLSRALIEKTDLITAKYPHSRSAEWFTYNNAEFSIKFDAGRKLPILTIKIQESNKILLTTELTMSVPKDLETIVNNKDIAKDEFEHFWKPYNNTLKKIKESCENINKYISVRVNNGTLDSMVVRYDTTHCKHKNHYGWDTLDVVSISNTDDGLLRVLKEDPIVFWGKTLRTTSSGLIKLPCNDDSIKEIVTHVEEFITKIEDIDKQETEQ